MTPSQVEKILAKYGGAGQGPNTAAGDPLEPDAILTKYRTAAGGGSPDPTMVPPTSTGEEPGLLESTGRGVLQGVTFGFADEIAGGLEALTGPKTYVTARDESRSAYKAAEEAHPLGYGLGSILGTVGTTAVTGGLAGVAGAGLKGAAAVAAVEGGLGAAGASEADNAVDLAKDVGTGAVVSGALGAGLHKVLGRYVNTAEARNARNVVQDITGGRATTAGKKIYEAQELALAATKKFDLNPEAAHPEQLFQRADAARKEVGAKLGEAYKTLGDDILGARTGDIRRAVNSVKAEYKGPSDVPIRKQLDAYLDNVKERWGAGPRDRITLRELNDEIGQLEKVGFKGAELSEAAGSVLKRDLAHALEEVLQGRLDEIKDLGAKVASTSLAKREGFSSLTAAARAAEALPELNRDYRGLKMIVRMAKERTQIPEPNRAAGGLRDIAGRGLETGSLVASLATGNPLPYLATKAGLPAVKALDRRATRQLAELVEAARGGDVSKAQALKAIQAGVPVASVVGTLQAWRVAPDWLHDLASDAGDAASSVVE